MEEIKSVITINEYGRIKICLNEIIKARDISIYSLARDTNTRFEVIKKWCSNSVSRLDLDVLARICYVLDCKPSDIIKYDKD